MLKKIVAAILLLAAALWLALRPSGSNEPLAASRMAEAVTPGDRTHAAMAHRGRERAGAHQRLARLEEEIAKLVDHPWGGVYAWDDGHGNVIRFALAPKHGITFFRSSADANDDLNHGVVVQADGDHLRIEFAIPVEYNLHDTYLGTRIAPIAEDLFVVRWGARRYLIAESQMRRFCNAVNDGSEGRTPQFPLLLSTRDQDRGAGLPEVPEAYRAWLLERPIEAVIQAVDKSRILGNARWHGLAMPLSVVVDAGSERGLQPGMVMWLVDHRAYAEGEVLEVQERSARLEFRFALGSAIEAEPLQIGWRVSTRRPE